ncbi:phosphatidylinositol 4-kinase A, partial [Phenoliferia sp. Uapishka_3]
MDSLDSCLHQSILSALASNLASTSTHDDLGLLTESFASVEPVTNGVVNGILARLDESLNGAEEGREFVTLQQAESIIAFAEYAGSSEPSSSNQGRIIALLQALPGWEVEASLGLQASNHWSLPDQLAYALVCAALLLAGSEGGDRSATLGALSTFYQTTVLSIQTSPGPLSRLSVRHRIISHILPSLNGFRRASGSTLFKWSFSDPVPVYEKLAESSAAKISTATSQEWDVSSDEGRTSLSTLHLYQSSLKGLSPALVTLVALGVQEDYFASALMEHGKGEGWARVARNPVKAPLVSRAGVQAITTDALAAFDSIIKQLEIEQEVRPVDPYSFDVLLKSITVATLSCIASGTLSNQLTALVETLASEVTPVTDEALQIRAVECLSALSYAFPSVLPQTMRLVREFILSPAPVFELGQDSAASSALQAACKCYADAIDLKGDPALRISAIQSLLNHFTVPTLGSTLSDASESRSTRSSTGTLSRSDEEKEAISTNVVHAVSRLALLFGDPMIERLVVSMLLQKHTGNSTAVDGALLFELAELCDVVDQLTFKDIGIAFSEVSKAPGAIDGMSQTILTAQTRLATAAGSRLDLQSYFLVEFLSLFVDTAIGNSSRALSTTERSQGLLSLVPVLDAFFTASKLDPRRKFEANQVALFRSFWYLCNLAGFLSTPTRIAEWQRAALIRIAVQSPCLVSDARHDFVETELEYSSILRRASHVLTPDVVRAELAKYVPQQAGHIRTLPLPQAVFLSTVLHVESLRAEAGTPSTMLSYFEVEGINNSPMFTTLVSIAEKYSKVRDIALRSLNDLMSSFPSLICEATVITSVLELLTVVRKACQAEFTDEYTPVYSFHSIRGGFSLTLPDDYQVRSTVLSELHQCAKVWLKSGISRAPFEMQGLLQVWTASNSEVLTKLKICPVFQDYIDGSSAQNDTHAASLADDEMGKSVAIDMIRTLPAHDKSASLPAWGGWKSDNSSHFARTFGTRNFYGGEASRAQNAGRDTLREELAAVREQINKHQLHVKLAELRSLLYRCAAHLVKTAEPDFEVLHQMVTIPVAIFIEDTVSLGQEVWTWLADARPELEGRLMVEVAESWAQTIQKKQGLFSPLLNREDPLDQETQYTPTDKGAMTKEYATAMRLLLPHSVLLLFLSSRFQAFRYRDKDMVTTCMWVIMRSTKACQSWSTHQLAREIRMRLLCFGFCVLQGSRLETAVESLFRAHLYDAAFSWFAIRAGWSYGANRIQLKADLQAVEELHIAIKGDIPSYGLYASTFFPDSRNVVLPGRVSLAAAKTIQSQRHQLLLALLENEIDRLRLWINPLMDPARGPIPSPRSAQSEHLVYWAPVPVVSALRFLFPKFGGDPILVQYALRVLEHHPVEVTFFYIPQVVQALRSDRLGYAERFIFETSKISQLFCHQIIWNMKANAYRGDAGEEPDPMKPTLDRMVEMIVASLSGKAQDFFQREFTFFDEVTSISAKLKPFIKESKLVKKAKIDEEMAKIKVDPGVYLPSNPDGVVVDIDRLSGRPLQSHAKAPFMATFKVHRESKKGPIQEQAVQNALINIEEQTEAAHTVSGFDTWQSAIFKVGDDCRQDVLALQIIAMHKNIFTCLGLDLLVTPYRVTATAPGVSSFVLEVAWRLAYYTLSSAV